MPVGPLCRSCGASLPPDIRWCTTCYTPVTLYTRRDPLYEPGGFVGRSDAPAEDLPMAVGTDVVRPGRADRVHPRTRGALPLVGSRRVQPVLPLGADGMGADGGVRAPKHLETGAHLDPTPTRIERLRARHPVLGAELRLSGGVGLLVLILSVAVAATAWLSLDDVSRYVWAVVAIVAGVGSLPRELERPVGPTTGAGRRAIPRAHPRAAAVARRPASCGPRSGRGPREPRPGPPRWCRGPAGRSR